MRAAPNPGSRSAGFLLAEMLTAFTISAFVLAGLVSLSAVLLRAVDRGVAHLQNTDDLDLTVTAVDRDIAAMTRARWAGTEPQVFLFNGDSRRLMFARVDASGAMKVIALKSDDANSRLLQADAALPAAASSLNDLHFGAPRILYQGGVRFRFAFIAAASAGTPEKRVAVWPIGPAMPSAILVESVDPATDHVLHTERATVRSNADVGCIEDGFCGRPDKPAAAPAIANAAPPAPGASHVGTF